ncbi:MAG: hypothetical protein L6V95_12755 [Candidatus Melainabacteria bacterium]|nr:MAG: hypothetical protein L6V95_12755 [Candidatus Melainabacteria bacterium]
MALTFGALTGGSAVALRHLEPYSLFGSAITVSILGIVATLLVLAIVFFKTDFFVRISVLLEHCWGLFQSFL